jgi:hypothetical protein
MDSELSNVEQGVWKVAVKMAVAFHFSVINVSVIKSSDCRSLPGTRLSGFQ